MANLLARLTMIWPSEGERVAELHGREKTTEDAGALPQPSVPAKPAEPSPIFINPKALTFPIAVGLVKGAWEAAKATPVTFLHDAWFPLVACLVIGLLIAISNLIEVKATFLAWVLGIIVGGLNSLVVFGAVMGIPGAKP